MFLAFWRQKLRNLAPCSSSESGNYNRGKKQNAITRFIKPTENQSTKMESHLKTKSFLSPEQSSSTFYDISCLRHCWLLLLTCQLEMQSMIILMFTSVLSLVITKELRIYGICTSGRTHTNRIKRRTHTMGNRVPNSMGRKVSTSRYAKRSQTKRPSTFIHPTFVLFSWSCPSHFL